MGNRATATSPLSDFIASPVKAHIEDLVWSDFDTSHRLLDHPTLSFLLGGTQISQFLALLAESQEVPYHTLRCEMVLAKPQSTAFGTKNRVSKAVLWNFDGSRDTPERLTVMVKLPSLKKLQALDRSNHRKGLQQCEIFIDDWDLTPESKIKVCFLTAERKQTEREEEHAFQVRKQERRSPKKDLAEEQRMELALDVFPN